MREAGVVRQDLTAIGVGVGPGPVHRAAGRPGHGADARLRAGDPGPRALLARRRRGRGRRHRHGRPATSWSPPTPGARRSTSRRTTARDAGATGPAVLRPDDAATALPVAGEGPRLYPESFPQRRRTRPAQRRLAGPRADRRARRAARPRAALPAPSRRRRAAARPRHDDPARPVPATRRRSRSWRSATSAPTRGPSALVARAWPARCRRRHWWVAERDGAVAGHAVVSIVAEIAELQRISVDAAYRRAGVASALLGAVERPGGRAGRRAVLLEVREDNAGARSFYAARGYAELDRRPRYYADGAAAEVMEKHLSADHGGGAALLPVPAGEVGIRAGSTSGWAPGTGARRCRPQVGWLVADVPQDAQLAVLLDLRAASPPCRSRCRSSSSRTPSRSAC